MSEYAGGTWAPVGLYAGTLGRVARRLARHDPILMIAALVLVLVVLGVVLAPLLAPYHPNQIDLTATYQGPSTMHLFGTDALGRDIFSRVLYGGRAPLLGSALIVLIATGSGVVLATTAVWLGGGIDSFLSRAFDIGFAFPGLLLAILAVGVFGTGLVAPVCALAVAYTPYIARTTRSVALRERTKPYVEACSVQGLSGLAICLRHILPNVFPFVMVQATVSFGYAMIDLASLSFLGLGVQPPGSDWGLMVSEGQPAILAHHPEESLFAGLAIVLTVIAVVMVGERRGALLASEAR